jgi:hypothetical protein
MTQPDIINISIDDVEFDEVKNFIFKKEKYKKLVDWEERSILI